MGSYHIQGKPFERDEPWGDTSTHQHALEVHRSSDTVGYIVDDDVALFFTVAQFEDLMRMASTIDYLHQPERESDE